MAPVSRSSRSLPPPLPHFHRDEIICVKRSANARGRDCRRVTSDQSRAPRSPAWERLGEETRSWKPNSAKLPLPTEGTVVLAVSIPRKRSRASASSL
ncbi:hypothetical protein chiPu_0008946 [Chiloscyllium punctatum]|uniref:Uncharacterized protein n=1 Tax=Chiloscyllium punctatum TaxID=137246 RepID=A0A401SJH9_CHIPU|nr:hypothetical protein [Chiloscyllium punctatum]